MRRPPVSGRAASLLVTMALIVPAPALAADPSPSAKELWQAYPLHPRTTQSTPTPDRRRPPVRAAHDGGGGGVPVALLAVLVIALAAGGGAVVWLRLRGRSAPAPSIRTLVPALPGVSGLPAVVIVGGPNGPDVTAAQARRPAQGSQRRSTRPAAARRGPPPPDPTRGWTAEIQWRPAEAGSAFWVIAEAADGSARAPIAQSGPLEWPPSGPAAVQALSAAADALEAALLAAGWQPLPQGSAWYSKRFQWEPAAAAAHSAEPGGRPAAQRTSQRPTDSSGRPAPRRTEPSQRFKREATAWPQDGRERWRCEIKWDAGYLNSRFQAVVYPPGGKPGRPAAASKPFKLMLRGEPDPHSERYRAEARALATAMQTAGWDPIGRGNAWYAERFVWRGDGEPPERVDPLSSEAVSSD